MVSYKMRSIEQSTGAIGAISIASTGVKRGFVVGASFNIRRVMLLVVTATTGATGTCTVKRRPTVGSATGEVAVTTMSITNQSAGVRFYKDINESTASALIHPGEELVFDMTVATGAGTAIFMFEGEEAPENPLNYPSASTLFIAG